MESEAKEQELTYMELRIIASDELRIINDVYDEASGMPEIRAKIGEMLKQELSLNNPPNDSMTVEVLEHFESFVSNVIQHFESMYPKIRRIVKFKSLDINDVLINIEIKKDKIIFSNKVLADMIVRKKNINDVIEKKTKASMESLGGEIGGLNRSMLRSYMERLDMVGKSTLVKKAYHSINMNGWMTMGYIIGNMGARVYQGAGSISPELTFIVGEDDVRVLDDVTDEELAKLGTSQGYFLKKSEDDYKTEKATISLNEKNLKRDADIAPLYAEFIAQYNTLPDYFKRVGPQPSTDPVVLSTYMDHIDVEIHTLDTMYTELREMIYAITRTKWDAHLPALKDVIKEVADVFRVNATINNKIRGYDTLYDEMYDAVHKKISSHFQPYAKKSRNEPINVKLQREVDREMSRSSADTVFGDLQNYYDVANIRLTEVSKRLFDTYMIMRRKVSDIQLAGEYVLDKPIKKLDSIDTSSLSKVLEKQMIGTLPAENINQSIKDRNELYQKNKSNLLDLDIFIKNSMRDNVRFIIIPIAVVPKILLEDQDSKRDLHANVIMIDTHRKTVDHYEPHGTVSQPGYTAYRVAVESLFGKPAGKYSGRMTALKDGFTVQTLATKLTYNNLGGQAISNYPYCLAWCMYIVMLRVLYPNASFIEIDAMSKSKKNMLDEDILRDIPERSALEKKYELLDSCDSKERIENFTIFIHKTTSALSVQQYSGSIFQYNRGETIYNTLNGVINNSEISLNERGGVAHLLDVQMGGDGERVVRQRKIKL